MNFRRYLVGLTLVLSPIDISGMDIGSFLVGAAMAKDNKPKASFVDFIGFYTAAYEKKKSEYPQEFDRSVIYSLNKGLDGYRDDKEIMVTLSVNVDASINCREYDSGTRLASFPKVDDVFLKLQDDLCDILGCSPTIKTNQENAEYKALHAHILQFSKSEKMLNDEKIKRYEDLKKIRTERSNDLEAKLIQYIQSMKVGSKHDIVLYHPYSASKITDLNKKKPVYSTTINSSNVAETSENTLAIVPLKDIKPVANHVRCSSVKLSIHAQTRTSEKPAKNKLHVNFDDWCDDLVKIMTSELQAIPIVVEDKQNNMYM